MSENRYALLIASSKFQYQNEDLLDLPSPENDVDSLYQLLISKDYGNFSRDIPPLKNESLTKIRLALEDVLIEKARRDDLVLIYYSGHGKPDRLGGLHLVATDTNPKYLRATALPFTYIKDLLLDSKTNKVIIILDCCYSGLAGKLFARGGLNDQFNLASSRGTYIMTSSTGTQLSWEDKLEKYGIFTKHIIEGIQDGTAADRDGNVTIISLYDYVQRQMQIEGKQAPTMSGSGIVGDMIITRVSKSLEKPLTQRPVRTVNEPEYAEAWYSNAEAWYNKGYALDAQGKYDEAIMAYDMAIEINPQYAEAWNNKGSALRKSSHNFLTRDNDAIKAYNKAIELDPQYAEAWNNKGFSLHNIGRYDEAIEALNKAIEINPQYADAWKNKGIVLKKLGRSTEADAAFTKAKGLTPNKLFNFLRFR